MKTETYALIPEDGHKSFYGKAKVIIRGDRKYLQSYSTEVCYKDQRGNIHKLWDGWSSTTGRHLRAFCGINKADWEALPREY